MLYVSRLFLLAVIILLSVPAFAGFIVTLDPVDGYDCADDMNTDDCFTNPETTSVNGPTVVACVAFSKKRQGCRSCEPAFYDNGQPKGYAVCAYVPWNGGCSCDKAGTPDCTPKASCVFYQ